MAEAGCRYLSLLLFEPVRLAPDRNPPDINGNVCLLSSWIRIVYALNDHKPLLGSLIFRGRLVKRLSSLRMRRNRLGFYFLLIVLAAIRCR